MIKSIEITYECIGDATQFQEAIPLGVVARNARGFQAENDADLAQADFLGHLGKAVASDHAGAGVSQVFIDHSDLCWWPTQLDGALGQLILALGGLAVDE